MSIIGGLTCDDANYKAALDTLNVFYGDPQAVVRKCVKTLLELKIDGSNSLRNAYSSMTNALQSLEGLKLSSADMQFLFFTSICERALPSELQRAWMKKCLARKDSTVPLGTKASTEDFFALIRDHMSLDSCVKREGRDKEGRKEDWRKDDWKQKKTAPGAFSTSEDGGSGGGKTHREGNPRCFQGSCPFCDEKKEHYSFRCRVLKNMSREKIVNILNSNKWCNNCMEDPKMNHKDNVCPLKECGTDGCTKKHNRLLHGDKKETPAEAFPNRGKNSGKNWQKKSGKKANATAEVQNDGNESAGSNAVCEVEYENTIEGCHGVRNGRKVILRTLMAWLVAADGSRHKVRVFLDSGAELCLIRRRTAEEAGLRGPITQLHLAVAGQEEEL